MDREHPKSRFLPEDLHEIDVCSHVIRSLRGGINVTGSEYIEGFRWATALMFQCLERRVVGEEGLDMEVEELAENR
jgi:hypothetical protein